ALRLLVGQMLLLGCSVLIEGCTTSKRQENPAAKLARMTSYINQREDDKAIQLGLDSWKNEPSDAFVYEQLVIACIKRADQQQGINENVCLSKPISTLIKLFPSTPMIPLTCETLALR